MMINDKYYIELKKRSTVAKVYYLSDYVEDLNNIIIGQVKICDLISLQEMDVFYDSLPDFRLAYSKTFKFEQKNIIQKYLENNILNWDSSYMVYLTKAKYCGLLKIPSLSCFNWHFSFTDERHGLIILIREDGTEKIVLDFYEEHAERFIDIKIYRPV